MNNMNSVSTIIYYSLSCVAVGLMVTTYAVEVGSFLL